MIYKVLLLAAFMACGLVPTALTSSAQNKQSDKYWIFFDGKPSLDDGSDSFSKREVTERATDRRIRKATAKNIDEYDRPVNDAYLQAIQDTGTSIEIVSRWLNAVTAFLTEPQLHAVEALPFVKSTRYVGVQMELVTSPPPLTLQTSIPPIDKKYSIDYGASFTQLDVINAVAPLERGINGTGVRIGILDTEFDGFAHEVFAQMIADNRLIEHQNFAIGGQTNRHGHFVASIMVGFKEGQLVGPGYGAELVAATTEYAPTETNQEEDDWVAGLEWLESMGVDVVNSSLAYSEFDSGQNSYTIADLDGDTGVTTMAADIAASLGVVMVNSAGNDGCSSPAQCWYYVLTPADGDSVIAVGAVNSAGVKSGFSSFGPTADQRIKPDVSAMGEGVYFATTGGTSSYSAGNGTSFSSPAVAGVVAQMLQVNPNLTPSEVIQILKDTSSQSNNPDNLLGYGIIDADAAVLQAQTVALEPDPLDELFTVNAFPNPVSEVVSFQITGTDVAGAASIDVYDILGRHIQTAWTGFLSGPTSIPQIKLNLPDGLYVYRFVSTTGSTSGTIVLVK